MEMAAVNPSAIIQTWGVQMQQESVWVSTIEATENAYEQWLGAREKAPLACNCADLGRGGCHLAVEALGGAMPQALSGVHLAGGFLPSDVYRLAYFDDLTGLPNRNLFVERMKQSLARRAAGDVAAIYFIDLDRFMRLNNTFGHAVGDTLIRQVAQRLQGCVGEKGQVARFGRDEFTVFSDDISGLGQVEELADEIMAAFASPFEQDALEFYVTLSMGICVFPHGGKDPQALLMNAENAMFRAKRNGRNNYQYYSRELNAASNRRLMLETALRRALDRDELFVQYQPLIDMASARVIGAEALIRWNNPKFGMISPEEFIPIADEIGMIGQIGEWVLHQACAQTKAWHEMGFDWLAISVNVSAVQFRQADLVHHVECVLERTGLKPHHLELEITETVLMQDAETTISALNALKSMGVKISVDDFGTGYSSLNYLRRFPIDVLKIDRSFVRDMTLDPGDAAIVRAITALAKSLKLSVLAEGVETVEQVDFLRNEKCDRMQGYLFSKPLHPTAMLKLVSEANPAIVLN